MKIRVCVVGYGNVGKEALKALEDADDMEIAGVVRRQAQGTALGVPVVSDVSDLGDVDVALLCVPSRKVPQLAPFYIKKGMNTVDCFDIHGQSFLELRSSLGLLARETGRVSVVGAGWDPGTDSLIRMIFASIAPFGVTYTDFGPGMSMGHTVAAKAVPGVKDALSMTLPAGFGKHSRDVYVELESGHSFEDVAERIKNDPYFAHDDTRVIPCRRIRDVMAKGHRVHIQRYGSSASAENQVLQMSMSLTNPSATAQIMVCAARASFRLAPGSYCLGEVPPVDLLPGSREHNIGLWV